MKLFLDDMRIPEHPWIHVRSYGEAISYLDTQNVDEISVDYDLGMFQQNGADVLQWILERVDRFQQLKIKIHSQAQTKKVWHLYELRRKIQNKQQAVSSSDNGDRQENQL